MGSPIAAITSSTVGSRSRQSWCPFNGEIAELCAEGAAVGTAVGDVEIEAVADDVGDSRALVDSADAEQTPGIKAGDAGNVLKGQAFDLGKLSPQLPGHRPVHSVCHATSAVKGMGCRFLPA